MNLLRSYHNEIVSMPVSYSWILDVENYCTWLNTFDKDANKTWARYRRMSLIAFASYYGKSIPEIRSHFKENHITYSRFPSKFDFDYCGNKIKLVATNVNERWNIGPMLHGRLTEKAYSKGNDYYILVAYDISRVSFIGWMSHETAGVTKNRGYYEVREENCLPMKDLKFLSSKDELGWYF
jgi:hypothetical protein